jgi:transposase-like protein
LKKALRRHGSPEAIVTDGFRSYGAALTELDIQDKREVERWANNGIENSHLPFRRRERAMLRFRQMKSPQKFASVHANLHNHLSRTPPHRSTKIQGTPLGRIGGVAVAASWASFSKTDLHRGESVSR